jgi:hypothetical protein
MLKSSPILSSSANASPASFRHAHSTNSRADSSTVLPLAPHRTSSRSASSGSVSVASSVSSRVKNHESTDTMSVSSSPRRQSAQNHPLLPPPSPRPRPMAKDSAATSPTIAPPAPTAASASAASTSIPTSTITKSSSADSALSPNKRRSSPAQKDAVNQTPESGPSTQTPSISLKRVKTDEQPPKVLPAKYELCPVNDMVELISQMLAELIATNDPIQMTTSKLTRFHSR